MNKIKILFLETRPHFLLLTPVCVFLGVAIALSEGYFNPLHLILVLLGSLFAHASVNIFNDYFDYIRGTDVITRRTPFSGGSGLLPSGLVTPKEAFLMATTFLLLGITIGLYFMIQYPILVPVILLGAFLVYAYTPVLTKVYITELSPGLGFGLMVVGTYITMLPPGSTIKDVEAVAVAVVPGILISNLLLLNEFPDFEADYRTGRKHMVILLGRKRASKVYVMLIGLAYTWIIVSILIKLIPFTAAIALATLPIAFKACRECLRHYDKIENLIPALAKNVLVTLLTPLLMAIGFIADIFFNSYPITL